MYYSLPARKNPLSNTFPNERNYHHHHHYRRLHFCCRHHRGRSNNLSYLTLLPYSWVVLDRSMIVGNISETPCSRLVRVYNSEHVDGDGLYKKSINCVPSGTNTYHRCRSRRGISRVERQRTVLHCCRHGPECQRWGCLHHPRRWYLSGPGCSRNRALHVRISLYNQEPFHCQNAAYI